MTYIQIAPDVEFKRDIDLPEVTDNSRDCDLQQHKAEVYVMFEARLKKAFPKVSESIRLYLARIRASTKLVP